MRNNLPIDPPAEMSTASKRTVMMEVLISGSSFTCLSRWDNSSWMTRYPYWLWNSTTNTATILVTQLPLKNHHHHLSLNCKECWGTTDVFKTTFLHFSLFFTALWDLLNSRPVHSLLLPSHCWKTMLCLKHHNTYCNSPNETAATENVTDSETSQQILPLS